MGFIIRYADGERVDQHELFEYLDSTGSVRALDEDEDGLVHISEIIPEVIEDGLPF